MTDASGWRAYVAAMVEKCRANQDDLFYRMALPGWEHERERLERELPDDSSDRPESR